MSCTQKRVETFFYRHHVMSAFNATFERNVNVGLGFCFQHRWIASCKLGYDLHPKSFARIGLDLLAWMRSPSQTFCSDRIPMLEYDLRKHDLERLCIFRVEKSFTSYKEHFKILSELTTQ